MFSYFQSQGEGGSQSQKKGLSVTELGEERRWRRQEEEEEAEEGAAAAAEAPPLQVLLRLGGGGRRRQEEPIQEVINPLSTWTTDLAATRYGTTCISFA